MMTVVNQYGNYLQGGERDAIINAVNADKTTVLVDDVHVTIAEVKRGDKETLISVVIDVYEAMGVDKLTVRSRAVRKGLYEVEGVMLTAKSMTEAIRKWRRVKK